MTSLEFEAGNGDYGAGIDAQYDPHTTELKTRLCVAQGNRLVNYYLFAGGINPPMEQRLGDGNERLSFTGERHGTAAPVGPEGQRGFAYDGTRSVVHALRANEPWLARHREEHDNVTLGLVLDAYATEYHHPESVEMTAVVEDLTRHRGLGPRRALGRSLLLAGYRFGAVHLERTPPAPGSVVVLGAGRYLSREVQAALVDHARGGGGVLLLGMLPQADLLGEPCTLLADALGCAAGVVRRDADCFYPTVVHAAPWLPPRPQTRVGWVQELELPESWSGQVVLTDLDGTPCGVEVPVGGGRIMLLAAELGSDPVLFRALVERLGARPGLDVDAEWPGLFVTTSRGPAGERALHVVNISGRANGFRLGLDGDPLFDAATLSVPPRSGWILPLGLDVEGHRILSATSEISGHGRDDEGARVRFRPGLEFDGAVTVDFAAGTGVIHSPEYAVGAGPAGAVRVRTTGPGEVTIRLA